MFVAMAAITVGQSGVEALFFDRVGPQALPMMYLLQGGAMFVAMLALTSTLGKLGPHRAYLGAPLALGGLVLAERTVLLTDVQWIYSVMWITVALANLMQGIFLWGIANSVVDIRQAKRLFPIFGAGGILGSVFGGVLTQPLASAIGTDNVLFVWAGGLGGTFALCRVVLLPTVVGESTARNGGSALRDMVRELQFVRHSSLLTWMTGAAVLFSILFYLLYLPYAEAASDQFRDADELAGFFGLFWAAGTAAAFLVSISITNRLLVWFGVTAMVVVLPLLYTASFGVLLAVPGFVTLIALRFTIGTWLQGVASPAWETLFNVVPESRRDQTRALMNGGAVQIGTVTAGVIALVGQEALSTRQFAVIGLVGAVLTIITTIGLRRSYISALVDALRAGRPQVFDREPVPRASVALAVDADSVGVLSELARSADVRERRLAFQLLALLPTRAAPSEVVRGLVDEDPVVRMAAIRALDCSTPRAREALLSTIHDPDPAVSAAGAARAVGVTDNGRPRARLQALLADPDDGVRRVSVEQLELAPADAAAALTHGLLADPDAVVRAAALKRFVAAAPDRGLDPALAGLRDTAPVVRIAAGHALGSASDRRHALAPVLEALDDPRTVDGAVEAIRSAELNGDGDRIRAFVRSATARATRDHQLGAPIVAEDDADALLRDAVLGRGRRVARSGLWAATMIAVRRVEMFVAIENLDGAPDQRANALETLDTAGPEIIRPLLALWDPDRLLVRQSDWLSPALHHEDPFIRRCAELCRARREGVVMAGPVTALSVIERLLFLRRVPLFVDLAPADLERVAELAEERGFADGEVIAREGEIGEELYLVIEGTVRVVHGTDGADHELARRTVGEPVGEMSLITHAPRIASLVAAGAVRTIRLGRGEFEGMLRERPDVALALMRVLALRIAESSDGPPEWSCTSCSWTGQPAAADS